MLFDLHTIALKLSHSLILTSTFVINLIVSRHTVGCSDLRMYTQQVNVISVCVADNKTLICKTLTQLNLEFYAS